MPSSHKVFVGIDPGAKGAICFLVPSTNEITFLPTTEKPSVIFEQLNETRHNPLFTIQMIMIEDVHAIQGTSAGSNFKFGFNVGLLHGIFSATGIGLDLVSPKTWQRSVGVKKTGKEIKAEVAEIASRLYPSAQIHGPKGGLLDGRSDALMIAHYNMLKYR
jgi:hypothetical protein